VVLIVCLLFGMCTVMVLIVCLLVGMCTVVVLIVCLLVGMCTVVVLIVCLLVGMCTVVKSKETGELGLKRRKFNLRQEVRISNTNNVLIT